MNPINNIQNMNLLKNIVESGEPIAFFIGAGASKPLGIDDWKLILVKLGKKAGYSEDVIIELINNNGFPGTASIIYQRLGDESKFYILLEELFTASDSETSRLHMKIVKWINDNKIENLKTIFTTNFDSSFEKAFSDLDIHDYAIQILPDFNPFILLKKSTIVYLHGHRKRRKYIFKKEEYDAYYPTVSQFKKSLPKEYSYELEKFLNYVFKYINIVFIGFSFEDVYFFYFLKDIILMIEKERATHIRSFNYSHPYKNVTHFSIIHEDFNNIEKIDDLGIKLITYGNVGDEFGRKNHAEIPDILSSIIESPVSATIPEVGDEASHAN